ncbi:MAG TPA: Crp/Fnr family transcriptional regulator [Pyrinomonadaceae bacterium]|nr:Crp/Fnr family transcriptional regulator [Pyrinomonadaceae bacterium]
MERKFISTLSRLIGGGGTAAQAQAAGTNGPAAARAERPNKAYLSAMRIFRDLSADEIKVVERSTVMTTAPKGKIVYQPEETGEILFLIKTGSVHLYRVSSEGRKFIVQTIGPMTFFGEMAIVGHNMYDLFAEAAEDCLLCVMGRADIERLLLSKPQIGLRMIEEIGQRMHDVQERLGDSVFKGVPARVASLLLKVSNDGEHSIKGLTHQDLADMLGIYRETVTNALDGLRDEGLVEVSRKEIAILNRDELRKVAEEEILRKR